ncbi:MAG: hypothetical protein IJA52_01555 [Clostridia bacterium]|nr:hypothetical protein [Clostridia bacterium]
MKRIIAIILAALMLVSFASCKASNGTGDDTTINEETKAEAGKDNNKNDVETTEKEEEKAPEFALGTYSEGAYENKYLGLGCKLSGDWSFYSEEQIKNLNNVTADVAGEDYQKLMEEASVVTDMYAIHSNGLDSINVNFEKIGLVNALTYDAKKTFEASSDMLKSAFANMGYENISSEITKVEFVGKEYTALRTTATISGIDMYQVIVADVRGAHVFNITFTTFYEDSTDKLLETFYKMK